MSLFSQVTAAPPDPILGLTEAFVADPRPGKVNLGVGVYQDESGKVPVLECVREAGNRINAEGAPRPYLPIPGMAGYLELVRELIFGAASEVAASGRVAMVQTLSGTGALKVGGDFLSQVSPDATVLVSDPSWENHQALFTRAGLKVGTYRYYDEAAHGIDFAGMLEDLAKAAPGTIVVLHPCCHNPTGYDLSEDQWTEVIRIVRERDLVPFVDMAYQGFSRSLELDASPVRRFAASGGSLLVSVSFSKTFSLYGERIGALAVVCADADEAARVLSQLKIVVRTNYSNPPTFGAKAVSIVLGDPELRPLWETELGAMRDRIKSMRRALVDGLVAAGVEQDMEFIARQVGMFSYSGLTKEQMLRLRTEFGIYGTDKGRICVAALNARNLDPVAAAIAEVLRG
jgi:Aspartate/tyrosine/aromatic aminotransferase